MSENMQAIILQKTLADKWDVEIDWSKPARELGDDTIASSTWAVNDPALVLSAASISSDNLSTIIWLDGGELGNVYIVTNTITTVGGRILTEAFLVNVVSYAFLVQSRCI
jgi:hypothetical protein